MSGKHSTSNTTETQTVTPTNPGWVTDAIQGATGNTMNLFGQDPKSFFAGPQSLNQQGFGLAGGIGDQLPNVLSSAVNMASNFGPTNYGTQSTAGAAGYNPAMMTGAQLGPVAQAQGVSALGGVNSYLNPASAYVAGNTINNLDRARQLTLNSNGDGALLSGQYGGSRQGVLDANTNRDFYSTLGTTLGNLYSQDYNTALGASQSDAERYQQAGLSNADARNQANLAQGQLNQQTAINNQNANNSAWQFNAGNAQQSNITNANNGTALSQFNATQGNNAYDRQLQGASLLGSLGSTGLNYLTNMGGTQQNLAQQIAGAPLTVNSQLSGDLSGLPLSLFRGSNSYGTSNNTQNQFGGSVGDLAKIAMAAMSMSDPRVKKDWIHVGKDPLGNNAYAYRMITDPPGSPYKIGVNADEIEQDHPEAVAVGPDGFKRVDYHLLNAKSQAQTGDPGIPPPNGPMLTPSQPVTPAGPLDTSLHQLLLGDQGAGQSGGLYGALAMLAGGGGVGGQASQGADAGGAGAAPAASGAGGVSGAMGDLSSVGSDTKLDLQPPAAFRLTNGQLPGLMATQRRRGLFSAYPGGY